MVHFFIYSLYYITMNQIGTLLLTALVFGTSLVNGLPTQNVWQCIQSPPDNSDFVFVKYDGVATVCAGVDNRCFWFQNECPSDPPADTIGVTCPDTGGPYWCLIAKGAPQSIPKKGQDKSHDIWSFSGIASRYDPWDPNQNHGYVNMGSCDNVISENDLVVALNEFQYDAGGAGLDWCRNKQCVEIMDTQSGQTTRAVIADRCAGCVWGQLDLTWAVLHALGRYTDQNFDIKWRLC